MRIDASAAMAEAETDIGMVLGGEPGAGLSRRLPAQRIDDLLPRNWTQPRPQQIAA